MARWDRQVARRRAALGATLAVGASLAVPAVGQAVDYTVSNTLGDASVGTLRKAVADSQAHVGSDRILFDPGVTGTINLGGQLVVTQPLEIAGPGAGQLTLDGGTLGDSIIDIDTTGVPAGLGQAVTVSGLTLANGGGSSDAGGIDADGGVHVTVSESVLSGNQSTGNGAAIQAMGTPLTVRRSTITGNQTSGSTGGILSLAGGLTLSASTVSGNSGTEAGGIGVADGDVQIANSTISGNTADTNNGGGALLYYAVGRISESTVSGNHAPGGSGGGIAVMVPRREPAPALTVDSSTIAGNSAATGGGIFGQGGGLGPETVAGPALTNTIVADNTGGDLVATNFMDPFSASFSLIETAPAALIEPAPGSNVIGKDPQLAALADNGGPTLTQAIPQSSPAFDRGSSSLATDQRGLARLRGAAPDIGAFELQNPVPGPGPGPGPGPAKATLTLVGKVKPLKNGVRFKLRCAGAACLGTARLTARKKPVGSKRFEIAAGKQQQLTLKLNKRGAKQLRKRRKLPVKLAIALDGASAVTTAGATIKAPKKRR